MFDILLVESASSRATRVSSVVHELALPIRVSVVGSQRSACYYISTHVHLDAVIASDSLSDGALVEILIKARAENARVQLLLFGDARDEARLSRVGAAGFLQNDFSAGEIEAALTQALYLAPDRVAQPAPDIPLVLSTWDPAVAALLHIRSQPTIEQRRMVRQILKEYSPHCLEAVSWPSRRFLFLLHNENDVFHKGELRALADGLLAKLAGIHLDSCRLAIGLPAASELGFRDQCALLECAMDHLLTRERDPVAFVEPETIASLLPSATLLQDHADLHAAVSKGNRAHALDLCNQLLAQPEGGRHASISLLRGLCADTMLAAYHRMDAPPADALSGDLTRLYRLDDREQMYRLLRRWIERMPRQEQAVQGSPRLSTLNRVMEILDNDDLATISPDAIAQRVSRSSAYISELFKQEMGTSLPKYLSGLRLLRAAELLMQSNMKVVDIAHAVGCDNYSYFCQIFRKRYGVSPARYREEHSNVPHDGRLPGAN